MIFNNNFNIDCSAKTLPFNSEGFCNAIDEIAFRNKNLGCNMLKDQLNSFFNKSKMRCRSCIYTKNTDKEFFGIYIKPVINIGELIPELKHHENSPMQIKEYSIELDSQLIDCITYAEQLPKVSFMSDFPTLNSMDLTAIILHDINAIAGCDAIKKVVDAINAILAFKDETLDLYRLEMSEGLFHYTIIDSIRGLTSCLCKKDDDNLANEFIRTYDLTDNFYNAINCIKKLRGIYHNDIIVHNIMVLNWYMDIYKKLVDDYIRENPYVIGMLNKALDYTGSELERVSITLAITKIANLPNTCEERRHDARYVPYPIGGYINSGTINESFGVKVKMTGVRSIEDDLYEFEIRIKNVTDEATAVTIMREINNNMNILSDYMQYEKLSEMERKKIETLYNKYTILREKLTKCSIYKNKTYGLFIDYNALDQMSEEEKRRLYMQ